MVDNMFRTLRRGTVRRGRGTAFAKQFCELDFAESSPVVGQELGLTIPKDR